MVKGIKSGPLMTIKSTSINSIQVLGSRVRWRARESSCLPKGKFTQVALETDTPTVQAQESGLTEMFTRDNSLMASNRAKVYFNAMKEIGHMRASGNMER